MQIKDLINLDMGSRTSDTPEVNQSYEVLAQELKKLNLDKKSFDKIDNLISTYAMYSEVQEYIVGFDSAVSLLSEVRSKINSMNAGSEY